MVMWSWGLINGAAGAEDYTALQSLSYVHYFGWAGMGIGLATAFITMGGGLRGVVLPRWFAILTIVFGFLGALGNAGIPPGGLVNYLLLPFWLIAASIFVAKRLRTETELRVAELAQAERGARHERGRPRREGPLAEFEIVACPQCSAPGDWVSPMVSAASLWRHVVPGTPRIGSPVGLARPGRGRVLGSIQGRSCSPNVPGD